MSLFFSQREAGQLVDVYNNNKNGALSVCAANRLSSVTTAFLNSSFWAIALNPVPESLFSLSILHLRYQNRRAYCHNRHINPEHSNYFLSILKFSPIFFNANVIENCTSQNSSNTDRKERSGLAHDRRFCHKPSTLSNIGYLPHHPAALLVDAHHGLLI